jgi:hypothetical protein
MRRSDIHVIPNYSYQVKAFCGKGFMCLGDAHRFIDPIFSFGLTVTMRDKLATLVKRPGVLVGDPGRLPRIKTFDEKKWRKKWDTRAK